MTEHAIGFEAAAEELSARKAWTLARLGEFINAGRAAGWLSGEPLNDLRDPHIFLNNLQPAKSTPMRALQTQLGLSAIEMDVLWLLVCIELEPALAGAAQLLVSPGMHELNAQILERLAAGGDAGADGEVFARLARFGLIETTHDSRVPLYRRPVRPNDRVIELARGRLSIDGELGEIATLTSAVEIRRETASLELIAPDALLRAVGEGDGVFVVATGIEGSGRATMLRHAISSAGRTVLAVRATALGKDAEKLSRQLRAIVRECRLHEAWPLLLESDSLSEHAEIVDRELIRMCDGPVFATSREACTWPIDRPLITIAIALPDEAKRIAMWTHRLPEVSANVARDCAARYTISPGLLTHTATAASLLSRGAEAITTDHVHAALRGQLERRLLGLAQRIDTRQTWDDLVLPVDQFDLLIEMVARVRHRRQVLDAWGFADKVGKGLGLSALLSGPPGTGKTMIAGLVARELGLDLYQVDLSKVVSKYIGETEKQLAALFEAAESGHAILLFDEADSLFGKRTEVKSSNDRYANLEVNYLLQRMEAFSGISLLTTNHETAIDKAFQRRLAFHIRVPMPDEKERAMLWTTMIPERAARADDLDASRLATEFLMSGGYIKNAVLRAAYLAANEGTPITNAHLWRAARAEYESMGKVAYQWVG
ncbi:MAG: ATPase central domain protein [Myxococcales bacterium]|nr:ATPase central domain protein [Myxococcales bacterium]